MDVSILINMVLRIIEIKTNRKDATSNLRDTFLIFIE